METVAASDRPRGPAVMKDVLPSFEDAGALLCRTHLQKLRLQNALLNFGGPPTWEVAEGSSAC